MSSLRNAIPRKIHEERAQPSSRKKFGFLEKHKDYVIRAKAYHKKEETLKILKEKAANRNPDEFYFKMIKTKTVDGVHRPESYTYHCAQFQFVLVPFLVMLFSLFVSDLRSVANKYTPEDLMLMKTQDIGYVLQKIQSEKKKVEKLKAMLHSLDNLPKNKHVYYAEDSEEENEILSSSLKDGERRTSLSVPDDIKRKMDASYRELEARTKRVEDLEKVYAEMALQKELQKKGKKRKLREEDLACPSSRPVYKWKAERKR